MNLAFDTDVAVHILRGREPIYRQRLAEAQAAGSVLHMPTITLHELMFGAMASARPVEQMARVDAFAARLHLHDWTQGDAMASARLRADLRSAGSSIGPLDVLIAGQALARGWTVVTGNLSEFVRAPSLALIDWRISSEPLDETQRAAQLKKSQPKRRDNPPLG